MSVLRRVSTEVRFGNRLNKEFDNTVKVTKLSPEQLERYNKGEKLEDILTGKEEVWYEKPNRDDLYNWGYQTIKIDPKLKNRKPKDLTAEEYMMLKGKGYTDVQIISMFNMKSHKMNDFKRKHGLLGVRSRIRGVKNYEVSKIVRKAKGTG